MEYWKKVTFSFCKGLNAEGKFSFGKEDYDAAKGVAIGAKKLYTWIHQDEERVKMVKFVASKVTNVVASAAAITVVMLIVIVMYLPQIAHAIANLFFIQ